MSLGFDSLSESPLSSLPTRYVTAPLYSNTSAFYGAAAAFRITAPLYSNTSAFYGAAAAFRVTAPLYSNTSAFYGAAAAFRITAPLYSNTSTFYGAAAISPGKPLQQLSSLIFSTRHIASEVTPVVSAESPVAANVIARSILYRNTAIISEISTELLLRSRIRIIILYSLVGRNMSSRSQVRATLSVDSVVAYQLSRASKLDPAVRL